MDRAHRKQAEVLPGVQVAPMGRGKENGKVNEPAKMTAVELSKLAKCESVINHGLQTFAEVGNALLAIRDGRLYRDGWGTFEAYCQERWGIERRRAYQLIDSASVMDNVNNCTQKPSTESQARPLSALPAEDQPKAWQAATEKAKAEDRPVTAKDVQAEVDKVRQSAIEAEEARYTEEKETRTETVKTETVKSSQPKSKGVALTYAAEAIAAMQRIPPKDGLRKDAWQMVRAWLTANE
jgi:hypothetical protein